MTISFDKSITQNFDEASKREWLETNGLGGWASSTISGAHTRRYHGLLVAATKPPVGRIVLLSKLDETIWVQGSRLRTDEKNRDFGGQARFELSANRYPGVVHPRGFERLVRFEKDLFPVFEYEAGSVRLRKTVAAVNGENTTLVLYEVLDATERFTLELQPFMAPRDYHTTSHANDAIRRDAQFSDGVFRVQAYDGVPEVFISVQGSRLRTDEKNRDFGGQARFETRGEWYRNFEYAVEQYRGLDFQEDLFTHGVFKVELKKGDKLGVIVSTDNPMGRDPFTLFRQEQKRRQELFERLSVRNDFIETLALAADQFAVKRGENLKTLIAGYHWFSDWGRDTMIALPGICLVTGRYDEAKKILRAFAQSVSQGMLPNRFPDAGEQPEYNTVDATLWFFVAIHKYVEYTGDDGFVRDELMPILRDIISWHDRGTRYNIHVDEDGLLYAGEAGVQLTWMDAKVGDWVVTPRQGKAVEINALWYNALMILSELSERYLRVSDSMMLAERAKEVKRNFVATFWSDEFGCLFDYVDGNYKDAALRPNQIFALSLPFPLLEGEKAKSVLRSVEEKLLTPIGLRSLSPDDAAYRPRYGGNQLQRDSAYHQGTVWSWLLGPMASAIVAVEGDAGKMRAKEILEAIKPHLAEACVGSISEIFDADAPFTARGCCAQAWGVGEILRAYVEDAHHAGSLLDETSKARVRSVTLT